MKHDVVLPKLGRVLVGLACAQLALAIAGCAHVPSEMERAKAEGQYQVGLVLVHDAEKAGALGDRTQQDAKYRDALRELLSALKTDPRNAEAHYLLAEVYFVAFHRHSEAESHLMKAIALKAGDYPEAENLLGVVLVDAGRSEEALPHFDKARSNLLYATPYFAEQEMGWALYKLGRYLEAAAHLRQAILAQPDLCGAYVKLADVEIALGDDQKAQASLQSFVSRCDTERRRGTCSNALLSYAYYQLGMAHLRTGDRGLATDALRQCQERFAREPIAAECEKSLSALEVRHGSESDVGTAATGTAG